MKNIYFTINYGYEDLNEYFEFSLWIDGKCIEDYCSNDETAKNILYDLVNFANIPCYKSYPNEVIEKLK